MVHITKCTSFLLQKSVVNVPKRKISKYLQKDRTAKIVRQRYLDYFINDCNHNFVRSSPVIPYCDPTVAFVNAGMNQGIFLGTQQPQYKRAVNSQKCVRVGGKHNDLSAVGLDGYHHTFFEMLGNWSFGDYFKKEACEMAWNLLTQKYEISKDNLYVTYFGGDEILNLKPDLECKDIWRSLGVRDERVLPFGVKDNFWEMGATGPCGPSTEIHVDLLGTTNRSKFINKGLPDLTELWNIVCIEYNRNADGSLNRLPEKHIDTGMGFERLTTALQGKISNYDTDNFTYLFSGIEKICNNVPPYGGKFGERDWNALDTNYRILADHARMIVVCLGDGVIPEQNQKLRRIIRKVFLISETVFKRESGLVKELSNYVVENLGPTYPELERNISQIHQIIDYEEEVYKSLRKSSAKDWDKYVNEEPKLANLDVIEMPGLIAAYKEIKALKTNDISASFGFKLYDTHGLDEETIINVSNTLGLTFDVKGFRNALQNAKLKSRQQASLNDSKVYETLIGDYLQVTDDLHKYDYERSHDGYSFKKLRVNVLKIIHNNLVVPEIEPNVECSIILDKSNLYTESGGQISDRGYINFEDSIFQITNTQNFNGYILHTGFLRSRKKNKIRINTIGNLELDTDFRLEVMRNHTATHLLNSALKSIKNATCQKSSKVTSNYLNFDVGIFGLKLTIPEIERIEDQVCSVIQAGVNVKQLQVDSQQLSNMNDVTLIPGEFYPNMGIRIIEIVGPDGFQSKEPCCGTHVLNTSDIEDFCIIGFKSLGRSTTSIHAVTGQRAKIARHNGNLLFESITSLQKSLRDNIDKPEILDLAVTNLKKNLKYEMDSNSILPVVVKHNCSEILNRIKKQIKLKAKGTLTEFIEMEMQNVLDLNKTKTKKKKKYIVHYLACSAMLDTVPLQKATKMCEDLPVIVISYSDSTVKARCCVPKDLRNKDFDAQKWLRNTIGTIFNGSLQVSKGQDTTLVCNMKGKKINIKDWDTLLKQSVEAAENFAEKHLN